MISADESFLQELIDFLKPMDLAAGSREDSSTINPKQYSMLLDHFKLLETDSYMLQSMKMAAVQELLIMKAVVCISDCKEIVAYLNRSGLKKRLDRTVKQEVDTRWNSHRDMLVSLNNEWQKVGHLHHLPAIFLAR